MKRLLALSTHTSASGVQTQSKFFELYVRDEPKNEQIVVKFIEFRAEDGEWTRDYAMRVLPTTLLNVFHTVGGSRVPLMNGAGLQVSVDEFTLMRFLCWDNAFASIKSVVTASITRKKAAEAAIRNGQQPNPYEFDLPAAIPSATFLAYLNDIYGPGLILA